jgi:hypothetical protein
MAAAAVGDFPSSILNEDYQVAALRTISFGLAMVARLWLIGMFGACCGGEVRSNYPPPGRVIGIRARDMVDLLHEIWIENDGGRTLESCCLAGPDGDGHRRLLTTGARLVHTFWAGCHYEAMTIYHRFLGREPYRTEHAWDHEPYPTDWHARQNDPR